MATARREFLKLMARAAACGASVRFVTLFDRSVALAQSQVPVALRPDTARIFELSVASGDPSPSGVVLWTRIRPDAVVSELPLLFQVASDASFADLVFEGAVPASAIGPAYDYTVRVDLQGRLGAGQRYYYRFVYGDVTSNVGRCRTLAAGRLDGLKLGLLTCQDYTNGYYGALRHLALDQSIDFVVHLGDFIYESAGDPSFQPLPFDDRRVVLPSGGAVSEGLDDYRALYRTYRSHVWLQRALEAHTFIITHDDHEVANDCYWDYDLDTLGAPDHPFSGDAGALRRLKLEAQRAWLEYVPARITARQEATHPHDYYESYRSFRFGDLIQLNMLDTRTYREPHPCGEGRVFERYLPIECDEWRASGRSMLGDKQRNWLSERLGERGALWNVLGNQTFFAQLALGPTLPINVDAWDGYDAERRWLTQEFRRRGTSNPVVLTGDLHSYIAAELKYDYNNLNPLDLNNYAGVEFMTPSVTTGALFDTIAAELQDPSLLDGLTGAAVFVTNPHIKFFESRNHGYSVLQFTRNYCEWTAYAVDKDVDPETAPRTTLARMRKYTFLPTLVPMSNG
jgi:alkaline phosphatase D